MVRLVPVSAHLLTRRRPQNFGISFRTVRAFAAPASNGLDALFKPLDTFERRHVGPDPTEVAKMLDKLGYRTMDEFVNDAVPQKIRIAANTVNNDSIPPYSESELLKRARDLAKVNKPFRSYIGMGYWNAVVPPVILRNVCPSSDSFATFAYLVPQDHGKPCLVHSIYSLPARGCPRSASLATLRRLRLSIFSGRLESLVNFQTMVVSLTGMHIANASLLDEATAAAEAMVMSFASASQKKKTFLVDPGVAPQTISVLKTRALGFGIHLQIGDIAKALDDPSLLSSVCGALVQYPDMNGSIRDFGALTEKLHKAGAIMSVATDLLALTLLKPPGEWGADIVLGNSARFGVPSGYGGPHAAFFAVSDKLKRKMPGRLIGRSKDAEGNPAYRLALQSEDTHIY
jgi:glycine dehydrogenase